jgi:Ca2+/Na+ antiporter
MPCESGIENLCLDAIDGYWFSRPLELGLLLYCFLGLGRVADGYLVTSLETLCVRLNVREDVAGASFMAFGSAAPEIIVNAVGTMKAVYTKSVSGEDANLGVGAIIGSGMIAFTLVPGACALASSTPLHLKRRPLLRDLLFYSIALAQLMYCIEDGVVTGLEAGFMLVLYTVYMCIVVWSSHVRTLYRTRVLGLAPTAQRSFVQGVISSTPPMLPVSDTSPESTTGLGSQQAQRGSLVSGADWVTGEVRRGTWEVVPEQSIDADDGTDDGRPWTVAMPLELDDQQSLMRTGSARAHSVQWDLRHHVVTHSLRLVEWASVPLDVLFSYTCPECAHDGPGAGWYPLTFIVSFLWVSFFSMVISGVVSHWGELSGVPPTFLGMAIIAIGAEVPDCIQSVTVAKRGYGSMAVSNSFGSQIINILIGLGVPWTMSNAAGIPIYVGDIRHIHVMGALQACNVTALFTVLLGIAFTCGQSKAVLNRRKGGVLLLMYIFGLVTYAAIIFSSPKAATPGESGPPPGNSTNGQAAA